MSLENPHRALCDAMAAGQLLLLINRKREDSPPSIQPLADAEALSPRLRQRA
jgi:hypothetical protein